MCAGGSCLHSPCLTWGGDVSPHAGRGFNTHPEVVTYRLYGRCPWPQVSTMGGEYLRTVRDVPNPR